MSKGLEQLFHTEMMVGVVSAKKLGYNAIYFLQMVAEYGAVQTAHRLLQSPEAQAGLSSLWELGRLDLSLENQILDPKYRTLFSKSERDEALRRLAKLGFTPTYTK